MKPIVLFLFVVIICFGCKAAKEKKQCLEFVDGKKELEINSFDEFKIHVEGDIDFEKVLWIRDGVVSSKNEILELIENRNILTVNSIKGANGRQLDGALHGVLIITTNKCLDKIK